MKRRLGFLVLSWIVLTMVSCTATSPVSTEKFGQIVAKMDSLARVPVSPINGDSLQKIWLILKKDDFIRKSPALLANVNYQQARLHVMGGQPDSARIAIERALKLIEPVEGNERYKTLIYNGVGNIRSMNAQEREASYYYNKAAAIVMSDRSAKIGPETSSSVLLSAAQSNLLFFQYKLAETMNRAALPLVDSLPAGHVNRQRVLVQMIKTFEAMHQPIDSVAEYLGRLEELHALNPKRYDDSFLYESKIKYFEMGKQIDSMLHYQLLKTGIDEKVYALEPASIPLSNLVVDYSNIAITYILLGQVAKGNMYIGKARLLKQEHPKWIFNDVEIFYRNALIALYESEGRTQDALKELKIVYNFQKEIYQTDNTKAVTEMNALYQLQVKDFSIKSLNERIKINQLEIQQNRLWLAIVGLGAILLATLLFSVYYSFRRKRINQEREKVALQQQLLRTQMEPHFIFNTLSAVQSFVRLGKNEEAIGYLNQFSRLLRSSLELSRENLVPLEQEIETLNNYLSLQQMRFEGAFTFRINQSDDMETDIILLPPMLIQPYVENAILHGVDMERDDGRIEIKLHLDGNILEVIIADSGNCSGLKQEKTHRSLSGTISRERMGLLGKKANVDIKNSAAGGTVVTLSIPVVFG
ncbi:MAG: histidine kinase [Sphingobacterium sp.]|jgi:tetratricopeptide (TPR) repeat protein|nr:histidine kinase [Sphingobacterium sp.]